MLDAEAPRVARGPRRAVWGVKQRTNSNELHPTIRPGYTNVPHRVGNRSNDIVSVGVYGALHMGLAPHRPPAPAAPHRVN